jgi:cation-transporting ATPase 13A2
MVCKNDFYPGLKKNKDYFDGEEDFITESMDQSTLFFTSNFLYLVSVISFSISKPFKKRFYTNIWFTLNLFILYIYAIIIIFEPKSRFLDFEIDKILDD